MGLIKVAGLLVVLFAMYGCGASSSRATGPSQTCVQAQDQSNSATSTSGATVGDTTFNCGPNRNTTDSHDGTASGV